MTASKRSNTGRREKPPAPAVARLSIRKKLVYSAVTLGLVLLALETAFRWFVRAPVPRLCKTGQYVVPWCEPVDRLIDHQGWYSSPPNTRYYHIYPDDPRQYFGSTCSIEYRINAEGFRGRSFKEDTGGRHRVLFVGDSFTFGEGVHLPDTFAALLETFLLPRVSDGQGVAAFHVAQPGHNPYMELRMLQDVGQQGQAELVVLVLTANDWPGSLLANVHGAEIRGEYLSLFQDDASNNWSRLFWWYNARWRSYRFSQALSQAYDEMPHLLASDSAGREALRQVLLRIHETAQVDLAIVVVPELVRLTPEKYPYTYVHDTISALAKAEGVQVIDLLPAFLGKRPEDYWVHSVDHHPNERAHAIIAERIARELKAPFLDPTSTGPSTSEHE
jgi:hypothetical protein